MRSRGALTIAAAFLTLALGGCSGDTEPASADSGSGDNAEAAEQPKEKIRRCKVTAQLSGAKTLSVSGKGRAVVGSGSGPDAFYEFTGQGLELTAYSEGEDFSPSVTLTVQKTTYSTLTETAGLDIARDGKSAIVDSDASGSEPDAEPVQVEAQFTCR